MGMINKYGVEELMRGINSAGLNLAKAKYAGQEAEQLAALRSAQAYSATMSGNKSGAQAESELYTLNQRKGVPDRIAADPAMTDYARRMFEVFQITGDTNAERVAKAGGEFQTQGIRQQAIDNIGDIDLFNRYNTAAKPGATYEPMRAVGNTGRVVNQATGTGAILDPTLAKLFDLKTNSEIGENNAQAFSATASGKNALSHIPVNQAQAEKTGLEVSRLKAGGTAKPLTAAQHRENTAIGEARLALQKMTQAEVDALENADPMMLTAGQRAKWDMIKRARRPMYGEDEIPALAPQPNPAPPAAEPGTLAKVFNWLTKPDERPDAKSAAAPASAPKMGKPSLDQWLAAARKANPGVGDDQLKQFYAQKYGAQ